MNSRHWIAVLGSALALLASGPAASHDGPHKDLTIVSWGGDYTRSQMLAYVKPYRLMRGEWVSMETYNGGLDEIREQVQTENVEWDVVDFVLSDLIRGCNEGLLETIDHSTLPRGDNGVPAQDDFIPGAFTECGVGQTLWSTVVAYDNDAVGKSPPGTLADFFDTGEFPGKRGLRRNPQVILEWALLADGVAPAEVYATLDSAEGVERAFAVMEGVRRDIVWWESGSDPIRMLDAGEVVMTSVWNGRMYRPMVEDGKPWAILWDGQVWDIDSWGIVKGSSNLDQALDFIRYSTGSKPLAEQTRYIPYGPARKSSMALVDEAIKPHLPTAEENMANALQSDSEWWASHHEEMTAMFEEWLAAGGRGLSGTAR